jgi:hypothetical protein
LCHVRLLALATGRSKAVGRLLMRYSALGLYAADPSIPRPQLYVVAVHHLGGFSKGFLIILAGYGCRDALNVIVPRQGIKPILWHVDLLSFPNRPIEAEIFSAVERRKFLREKNLPANVRDRTFRMAGAWRRRYPPFATA